MFDKKSKILVVDDMSTMRKVISKMLAELGFGTPSTAENGKAALEILKVGGIHFIISDWNMPEMTGLDLLKAIRSDNKLKTTPFLMLTAESEDSQKKAAADAGVDAYLTKPFNKEGFKQALLELFTHSQKKAA